MHCIIVGFGLTGFSVLRYLLKTQVFNNQPITKISILDTRSDPPEIKKLKALDAKQLRQITCHFSWNPSSDLSSYLIPSMEISKQILIVSPGLNLKLAFLEQAKVLGIKIMSDIELFLKGVREHEGIKNAKFIGITGSNGKSTVTSLVGFLLNAGNSQTRAAIAGNIGKPVLELGLQNDLNLSLIHI